MDESNGSSKLGDTSEEPRQPDKTLGKHNMIRKLQNNFMQLKKVTEEQRDRYVKITQIFAISLLYSAIFKTNI